jgi:hypothetical protein
MIEMPQMSEREFRDVKQHIREQLKKINEYVADMSEKDSIKLDAICDDLGILIDQLQRSDGKNKEAIP